ncbi:MAG TPA: hypothetical protein DG754_02925, partial [Bacteroidales bacterium]|nr:hypothetical protein [Bacteroidales bacterium]
TLNQLALYAGYNGWDSFHNTISSKPKQSIHKQHSSTETSISDTELSLIRFCLQDGAFGPLMNYFHANRDIFGNADNPKTISLFSTLTDMLNNYPKIRHRMFSYMLKDDFLGKNYFAYQVNADAIATYYGDAVDQYFMRMLHPSDNRYESQLTWANTILMMQAFYQGNVRKLLQIGYELFRMSPPETNTLAHHLDAGENEVWVFSRYHFVHILYLYYSGKANSMEQKVRLIIEQLSIATNKNKLIAYSFIFEALTFTEHQHLIACFTNDYIIAINSITDIYELKGERLKVITAVIFFYTLATSKSFTNSDFEAIQIKVKGIKDVVGTCNNYKLYRNTYHVYMRLLEAMLVENPVLRKQYFTDAHQHALSLKNKYFIQQIEKLGF